jgi:hypothetical protein
MAARLLAYQISMDDSQMVQSDRWGNDSTALVYTILQADPEASMNRQLTSSAAVRGKAEVGRRTDWEVSCEPQCHFRELYSTVLFLGFSM